MRQQGIQPWNPRSLMAPRLERQHALSSASPFRYLNVVEGLAFYAPYAGSWVTPLTRERFVQLSMDLFNRKQMHMSYQDGKLFYDVFDVVDIYQNASLCAGELAGGVGSFFGGTLKDHTDAVLEVLDASRTNKLSKSGLKTFLQPFVWGMVPPNAVILRPLFIDYVTDDVFREMSFTSEQFITREELFRWFSFGRPRDEVQNMAMLNGAQMDVPLYTNQVIERCARSIEVALQIAWKGHFEQQQLREYGQQTWQTNYNGRPQYIHDVGLYRAVENAASPVASTAPALWDTLSTQASSLWSRQPEDSQMPSQPQPRRPSLVLEQPTASRGCSQEHPFQNIPPPPPPPESPSGCFNGAYSGGYSVPSASRTSPPFNMPIGLMQHRQGALETAPPLSGVQLDLRQSDHPQGMSGQNIFCGQPVFAQSLQQASHGQAGCEWLNWQPQQVVYGQSGRVCGASTAQPSFAQQPTCYTPSRQLPSRG